MTKQFFEKIMMDYGIDKVTMAKRIGVSESHLSHIINGKDKASDKFKEKFFNNFRNAKRILRGMDGK